MQTHPIDAPDPQLPVEEAKELFRRLVRQHGIQWGANVPKEDYNLLARVNEVLTTQDRKAALGLN